VQATRARDNVISSALTIEVFEPLNKDATWILHTRSYSNLKLICDTPLEVCAIVSRLSIADSMFSTGRVMQR
jgi:hypothetical protein